MHSQKHRNPATLLTLGLAFSLTSLMASAEVIETLLGERYEKEILHIDGSTIYFADKSTLPLDLLRNIKVDAAQSPAEQDLQNQRIETIYKRVDLFDLERGFSGEKLLGLLLESRYEELENSLDDALSRRTQYGDGYWHLPIHYEALRADSFKNMAPTVFDRTKSWMEAKPESVHARAIYLQLKLRLAGKKRGSGLNNTVSEQNRSAYKLHVDEAAKISAEIDAIPHSNPASFEPQIRLAMVNGDQTKVLALVDRATSIEPLYWPVYTSAVPAMMARWGASPAQFQALMSLMEKKTPESFRDEFYYRIATTMFRQSAIDYVRGNFDWSRVKRGFSDVAKRYTLTDGWQHRMATIAFVERDMNAMKKYFKQSYGNGSPTKNALEVWRTGTNLMRAQEQLFMHTLNPQKANFNAALRAIANNDPSLLKQTIKAKFDSNAVDHLGNTLLHSAVAARSETMVEMLLEANANPNIQDGFGRTALHDAAAQGSSVLVQQLLSAGADPLKTTDNGSTPLLLATRVRDVFLLNLLLTAAPPTANIADENGLTPLIVAAKKNNQALSRLLLAQPEIELNSTDKYGYTALHWAVGNGDGEITELLLNAKADHGLKSNKGLSVFDMAKSTGREEMLPILREYGVIE